MKKLYKNKNWLKEMYWNKKIDTSRIATICQVTPPTIRYWMTKFNISRRSTAEAIHYHYIKTKRLYNNEDWLREKYIKEKLSTIQIGKICKVGAKTIRKWLKIYNIPIRSIGESNHFVYNNHCNLSEKAIEWLNGELLGDGCLYANNVYSARWLYSSKYQEYINYICDILNSFGIIAKSKKVEQKRWNRKIIIYQCQSRQYPELLSIYKKWYPNGKKIVPKDLKLTPLTIRQWYIGDGNLLKSKRKNPCIQLHTNGFTISDVNLLINKLNNLNFKATRQPSRNIITISTYSTRDFLNYIGNCPVKCYRYKWNYNGGDIY